MLDIIFKNEQPIGAYPGGSTFNAVISLARAGVPATFISETGNDRVGQNIINFLKENGVDASNVNRYPESKSPVSLAFLNDTNDAEYIFYKDHPHDQLDFVYPDIQPDDVVLFGSFYAVNPVIRPQVVGLLEYARSHRAIIYYDVNFRPSHRNEVMKITPNYLENLEFADIVRGSHEDFEVLYKLNDSDKVYNAEMSFYCKRFIYTNVPSRWSCALRTSLQAYEVEQTTGEHHRRGRQLNADSSTACQIWHHAADIERGSRGTVDEVIACAQKFSADCCKSIYNNVSKEFGANLKTDSIVPLLNLAVALLPTTTTNNNKPTTRMCLVLLVMIPE